MFGGEADIVTVVIIVLGVKRPSFFFQTWLDFTKEIRRQVQGE